MEVFGGILAESSLIKSEDPDEDDANIVEIRAEDIQDEIKKETVETIQLEDSGNNNIVEIGFEDIRDQGVQKVDKRGQIEDRKKSDSTTVEHVQEKLILNSVHWDLGNKKRYRVPRKKYDQIVRVDPSEYSLKDKKYQCNHCQVPVTSKKNILRHIRMSHRHTGAFQGKEEKLKNLVNTVKSRYFAWYEYTPEDDGQYRCSHCQVLFQGQQQVERHIMRNHRASKGGLWKQCPHCPYRTMFDLTYHTISIHTKEKDIEHFRCDKCDFKSKLKNSLRRHIICMHMDPHEVPNRIFKCSQCPRVLKKKESLLKHIKNIHNPNSVEKLKCDHCPYDCVSKESMKHHVQTHHTNHKDLKTLRCPHCAFKTKFKMRLQSHISISHKRILQCHVCSYKCTTMTNLDLHLITHKKDKNEKVWKYRCDKCDYKTYRGYSLQIHKLNHLKPEEIQYFYCYHCDFKAKRKDNLKTHVLRHFKRDEISFPCFICDFKTNKRHLLVRHIDGHAKEKNKEETKKIFIRVR